MKTQKTLIDEIAIEAMKASIIAKSKNSLTFSECSAIAEQSYDIAQEMIKEGAHIDRLIADGEVQ